MKKKVFITAIFVFLSLAVASAANSPKSNASAAGAETSANANKQKAPKFSLKIIPTRQDSSMDWWIRVPTPPVVLSASKGWLGDKISFHTFVNGLTKNDNEEYELKLTMRGGCKGELKNLGEKTVKGKLASPFMVTIAPVSMDLIFEKEDKLGTYIIEVDAVNLKTGERASGSASCEYEKWVTPSVIDNKAASEIMLQFNMNFSPEKLYQSFMSEKNSFRQHGPWFGLNPAVYSFYKHAFTKNKFMLPILREDFKKATPRQRENIILLFAFLGEKPFEIDALSPDEVVMQTQMRKVAGKIKDDPYKEIKQPGDLDLLWGEFFALGTYKPARRLFDALADNPDRPFAEKILNGGKVDSKDAETMRKLFQGMIPISAEWSILSNLRNELFKSYMRWAFENDMPMQTRKNLLDMFKRAREGKIQTPSAMKKRAAETSAKKGAVQKEKENSEKK